MLSLTWDSPYLGKTVFILRRGLGLDFIKPDHLDPCIKDQLILLSYFFLQIADILLVDPRYMDHADLVWYEPGLGIVDKAL